MKRNSNNRSQEHVPVLLEEVLNGLHIEKGKKYIDATYGLGGHAQAIVQAGGLVLGIEKDEETIKLAKKTMHISSEERKRLVIVHGTYRNLNRIAAQNGFATVSGILFDLGFSSWQLDKSGRGFRFLGGEPLDMRFDTTFQTKTASEIVNRSSRHRLVEILSMYAEEEDAEEVGNALYKARPIMTNSDLLKVLDGVFGVRSRRRAARVFQAFRIAVNDELSTLKLALPQAREILKPGGRLAIISFHSLEDRIVKRYLKQIGETGFSMITKKPITAGKVELRENPRAKSAKLRIAMRMII